MTDMARHVATPFSPTRASVRPRARRALSRSGAARWRALFDADRVFRAMCASFAAAILALLALIAFEVAWGSRLSLRQFGFRFVYARVWDPVRDSYGALTFVYGTLVSSAIALLLAVPLGIGIAVFLVEMSPRRVRAFISFLIELLAAIPSVVYGLWGLFVLAPIVRRIVAPFLHHTLGFLPLFQGESHGVGMLTAGIILAIMILPFIAAVSRDVLMAVPVGQREASLALGATKWETVFRAVLPYGRAGIVGAVILALGRALGETMAVTMVIGNTPQIARSLFEPGYTMASVIANEYAEASGPMYLSALTEIGLLLFGITFAINGVARLLIWRMARACQKVSR